MLRDFAVPFNWLRAAFRPAPLCPPVPPDIPCPLQQPDAPLPVWVEHDPIVQKYRTLLGDLPWADFPERAADRNWPGPQPDPRAPFAAAFLVKLHEGKRFMSDLRTFLLDHPALVYYLGFERLPDPTSPFGFDVELTVPKRRHLSTVLRTCSPDALAFLLDASVRLLQATLPADQQHTFGDTIAGDTQAMLAWVRENNPKQFVKDRRFDKERQPKGDRDCTLGVKKARNSASSDADACNRAAPAADATPASRLQVGVDILWGYASGIVVTKLPDGTEVVLAERTRPFNESDPSYFAPLMTQTEQRLGRKPRFGTWDAAYDAHYVYDYFHGAGGFAAVPFNPGGPQRAKRAFAPDGSPLCAAKLPMTLQFTYLHRSSLTPEGREKFRCPLLFPQPTGETCPTADAHWETGGCTTTIAMGAGSRIRHTLDRERADDKQLYAQRTMVERINSQAEALFITRPKLRRGRAIANHNTLLYVLINLRAYPRATNVIWTGCTLRPFLLDGGWEVATGREHAARTDGQPSLE